MKISTLTSENTKLIAADLANREKFKNLESVVQREVSAIAASLNTLLTAVWGERPNDPNKIFGTTCSQSGVGRPSAIDKQQKFQPSKFETTLEKSKSMPDLSIMTEPSSVTVSKLPEPCDSSTSDKALPCRTDTIPPLGEDSTDESDNIADDLSTDDEDWNKPLRAIAEESYFSASCGRSTITGAIVNKTTNSSNLMIPSKDKTTECQNKTSTSCASNKENIISPLKRSLLQQQYESIIPLQSPSFEQNQSNGTPLHSPSFKHNQSNCTPLQSPSLQNITPLSSPFNGSNVSITLLQAPQNRSSDHITGRVVSRRKANSKMLLEVPLKLRNRTTNIVHTSPIRSKSPIRRSITPLNESSITDGTLMVCSTPYATRRTTKRHSTRMTNNTAQLATSSETSQSSGRPKRKAAPTSLVEPKMNSKLRRPSQSSTSHKSRRSKSK